MDAGFGAHGDRRVVARTHLISPIVRSPFVAAVDLPGGGALEDAHEVRQCRGVEGGQCLVLVVRLEVLGTELDGRRGFLPASEASDEQGIDRGSWSQEHSALHGSAGDVVERWTWRGATDVLAVPQCGATLDPRGSAFGAAPPPETSPSRSLRSGSCAEARASSSSRTSGVGVQRSLLAISIERTALRAPG